MSDHDHVSGFISAPIKLAALINNWQRSRVSQTPVHPVRRNRCSPRFQSMQLYSISLVLIALLLHLVSCANNANIANHQHHHNNNHLHEQQSRRHSNEQPRGLSNSLVGSHLQLDSRSMRHQAHYLNIAPSTHFSYDEGRQSPSAASEQRNNNEQVDNSQAHIYKRSSALISSPGANPHYPPLVSSTHHQAATHHQPAALIRRRMMSEGAQGRWLVPSSSDIADAEQQQPPLATELLVSDASEPQHQQQAVAPLAPAQQQQQAPSQTGAQRRRREREEAELLRQKQHIQYHDQWPSMAGKCHKRTLNFCASVLPFNTTTFPNIIGDTNRFEVKRSLPFFGFLAKSSCNARLDELLCLLLEPPCSSQSGAAIPPCKKFCRLALEGCNEYIPATLAMSSVFDCRQYPDSSDPSVCINLAQGSKCAPSEFKCPDKTCIPRNWLCDGVRDCIFAADEANCTAPAGIGLQTSVCSTEEFKCDGKCVPKAWKCDGERDCLDGSDEESCDLRPRCGPDRFRCADGNGCLPKRWVCDGKAECRDGSDELNCEQLECSENDFKCDNGICIPKLWRCDRQFDCKDGSDERSCIYPTSSTTTTTQAPTTSQPAAATATTNPAADQQVDGATETYSNVSLSALGSRMAASSATAEQQQQQVVVAGDSQAAGSSEDILNQLATGQPLLVDSASSNNPANHYLAAAESPAPQLESNLNEDVSRIIRQESSSSSSSPSAAPTSSQAPEIVVVMEQPQAGSVQQQSPMDESQAKQQQASKALNKFDYDIIQSSPSQTNLIQSDLMPAGEQPVPQNAQHHQMMTQIDFVPQQRQQRASNAPRNQYPLNQQQAVTRPLDQQHQQRVPIYRSLFKSLKGGQGRFAANGVVGQQQSRLGNAGRRRRDRLGPFGSQQPQQPVMTTQAAEELAKLLGHHWSPPPATQTSPAGEHQLLAASSPAPTNQFNRQAHNQTRAGVASYLQLLNSRYNLRLSRVAPVSR